MEFSSNTLSTKIAHSIFTEIKEIFSPNFDPGPAIFLTIARIYSENSNFFIEPEGHSLIGVREITNK
jgi:hypothetical protein